jgi:DHA2 family multidrug resistance protein
MFMQRGSDWATATQQALAVLYGSVQKQAALLSFIDVFYLMAWLFLLVIPLVLVMRKPKRTANAPPAAH